MSDSEKVFKTTCPKCKETFHLRRSLVSPDAEGTGEVKTKCFHCDAEVMITVPRPYIEKGSLTFQEDE
ncbi:MAG: hypothetical protein GY795_37890 [Desulfobacterales bacterium]|nr:hypothetical protein [Desulfobacterales bacterium]